MMLIDMTKDLAPVLYGLNVALIVSTLALVGTTVGSRWVSLIGRIERPHLTFHRPALAR